MSSTKLTYYIIVLSIVLIVLFTFSIRADNNSSSLVTIEGKLKVLSLTSRKYYGEIPEASYLRITTSRLTIWYIETSGDFEPSMVSSSFARITVTNLVCKTIFLREFEVSLYVPPVIIGTTNLNVEYISLAKSLPSYFIIAPYPVIESIEFPSKAYIGENAVLKLTLRNKGIEGYVYLKIFIDSDLVHEDKFYLDKNEVKYLEVPLLMKTLGEHSIVVEVGDAESGTFVSIERKNVLVEVNPYWSVRLLKDFFNVSAGTEVKIPVEIKNPYDFPVEIKIKCSSSPTEGFTVASETLTATVEAKSSKIHYVRVKFSEAKTYKVYLAIEAYRGNVKLNEWKYSCSVYVRKPEFLSWLFSNIFTLILLVAAFIICAVAVFVLLKKPQRSSQETLVKKKPETPYPKARKRPPKPKISNIKLVIGKSCNLPLSEPKVGKLTPYVIDVLNRVLEPRGYRVLGKLGEGGFAVTLLGQDERGINCVLKVAEYWFSDFIATGRGSIDEHSFRRFKREAEVLMRLNKLNHIHIVKYYGYLRDIPILILEYCEGGSLRDLLNKRITVPLDQALMIGVQIADALVSAYSIGLKYHADIKPSNILLSSDKIVKLTDFNIAGVTWSRSFSSIGYTLGYAPPEQVTGGPLTEKTDVFQLAVTLYEIITGNNPYLSAGNEAEYLDLVRRLPLPPDPKVPNNLLKLLLRATSYYPEQRPSMSELRDKLFEIFQEYL